MAHLTGLAASHPELRMLVLSLCRFVWIWEIWVINSATKKCQFCSLYMFWISVWWRLDDFGALCSVLRKLVMWNLWNLWTIPGPDVEPGAPNLSVTEAGHLYGYGSKLTPIIGWLRHVKTQNGLKPIIIVLAGALPIDCWDAAWPSTRGGKKMMAAWKLISEQVPNGFVMSPQKIGAYWGYLNIW